MFLVLMARNHDLVHQALNDECLALVKLVSCIARACAGNNFWLQCDIILKAFVLNLDPFSAPSVKCFDHLLAFSIFPASSAFKLWSLTLMTCHRTPGISPFARPIFPPMHSMMTSSCSSMSFVAPSPGQNALTCLPFFVSWTRTHFLIAELGCFASSWIFSNTRPFACDDPSSGSDLSLRRRVLLIYGRCSHFDLALLLLSLFAANMPQLLLPIFFPTFLYYPYRLYVKKPLH